MDISIAVCGAGTMGTGIAQLAAQSGFDVLLFDIDESAVETARRSISENLQKLVEKSKISLDKQQEALSNIRFTNRLKDCTAFVIIEAIAERQEAKISLFNELARYNNEEVLFASNTSSLSISAIQASVPFPQRVAGMHFFNPPFLMPLVEIIRGDQTQIQTIRALTMIAEKMGKKPVICRDSPGFIVNRIARPYYLEALRLLETSAASFKDIDQVLEATGFKMGPFRLMDLIGLDINLATSESVYEALGRPSRLKPSDIQKEKTKKGELGRKSGKGFYLYS